MKNKILSISGTTATGKTSLAIEVSKLFPSTLISADSRQVYKGVDIVTGKDHPTNIQIHGLDLINPDQEYSVAQWNALALRLIEESWGLDNLPIIIGGTGLYLKSLTHNLETISIPPDDTLRQQLAPLNVSELQNKLSSLSPSKLSSMNNSDRHNPRRLVRAIEVASTPSSQSASDLVADYLHITLIPEDLDLHKSRIKERVLSRIENGAVRETKNLLKQYSPDLTSFSSLGYKHLISYINQKISQDELVECWTADELAYSKSQITWFNKQKNTHVFDPHDSSSVPEIVKIIKTWYSEKQHG